MPLLVWWVLILLDDSATPGRAGLRQGPAVDAAPGRGRTRGPPVAPGGRMHGNAVGALPAPTVHRVGRGTGRRAPRGDVAHREALSAVCYSASLTGACHRG